MPKQVCVWNNDASGTKTCSLHRLLIDDVYYISISNFQQDQNGLKALDFQLGDALLTLEEDEILNHLSESGDWVRTLPIAKAVVGPDAIKKDVNPTLYSLEEQGLVKRKEFKKKYDWHWKLSSGETEDMVTKSPEVKMEVEEEKVRVESQQEIVNQSGDVQ